jgi:hypothetical protein
MKMENNELKDKIKRFIDNYEETKGYVFGDNRLDPTYVITVADVFEAMDNLINEYFRTDRIEA